MSLWTTPFWWRCWTADSSDLNHSLAMGSSTSTGTREGRYGMVMHAYCGVMMKEWNRIKLGWGSALSERTTFISFHLECAMSNCGGGGERARETDSDRTLAAVVAAVSLSFFALCTSFTAILDLCLPELLLGLHNHTEPQLPKPTFGECMSKRNDRV